MKKKFDPETPIGKPPKCPVCGCPGVLLSRTKDTGNWRCWAWQCRHRWTTHNSWPRRARRNERVFLPSRNVAKARGFRLADCCLTCAHSARFPSPFQLCCNLGNAASLPKIPRKCNTPTELRQMAAVNNFYLERGVEDFDVCECHERKEEKKTRARIRKGKS
jgi:hypothetical protein